MDVDVDEVDVDVDSGDVDVDDVFTCSCLNIVKLQYLHFCLNCSPVEQLNDSNYSSTSNLSNNDNITNNNNNNPFATLYNDDEDISESNNTINNTCSIIYIL